MCVFSAIEVFVFTCSFVQTTWKQICVQYLCVWLVYAVHCAREFISFSESLSGLQLVESGSVHYFCELLMLVCQHRKIHTHKFFEYEITPEPPHILTNTAMAFIKLQPNSLYFTIYLSTQLNANRLNEVKAHKRHFQQVGFNYVRSIKLLDGQISIWHKIKSLNEYNVDNILLFASTNPYFGILCAFAIVVTNRFDLIKIKSYTMQFISAATTNI